MRLNKLSCASLLAVAALAVLGANPAFADPPGMMGGVPNQLQQNPMVPDHGYGPPPGFGGGNAGGGRPGDNGYGDRGHGDRGYGDRGHGYGDHGYGRDFHERMRFRCERAGQQLNAAQAAFNNAQMMLLNWQNICGNNNYACVFLIQNNYNQAVNGLQNAQAEVNQACRRF